MINFTIEGIVVVFNLEVILLFIIFWLLMLGLIVWKTNHPKE